MFDKSKLKKALIPYKKDFVTKTWPNEKYKWEAVKCFQLNWDVNADDFAAMLTKALSQTGNLLVSANYFPANMIEGFANSAREEVRAMFIELFDESKDTYERVASFKNKSSSLLERYGNGAKQHYQYENTIMTYLWLRYPDKYSIFKFGEAKAVAAELEAEYTFKKGAYADNVRNFIAFYDEICAELQKDDELRNMLASQITPSCYDDPQLRTLTIDVGFYISKHSDQKSSVSAAEEWWPTDYSPALTAEDWISLIGDSEVFTESSMAIMKRMLDYGGKATCKQLSVKYGESPNFYNTGSVALARRVVQKTNCPIIPHENDSARFWPILYVGKNADKDEDGAYVWKLRPELEEALKSTDLSSVALHTKLIPDNNPAPAEVFNNRYDKEKFLSEVYMTEAKYERLRAVLLKKKNVILQGAPGVGKTFAAKRLAYSIIGETDDDRIEFVQFHQNYSYEDFVMGYKPVDDGFELRYGIFYRFCQKAANHSNKEYFFIIDEINRGNMSKIFGELLMLIDSDYRERQVTLAYNGLPFSVPKNLYIIGMMNTADRSLAMIDYALRRRFSFFEIDPGFDSVGFSAYQKQFDNDTLNILIDRISELNREITADKSLGKGFCIGHSYFCNAVECTDDWMKDIVDFDILPMLSEYWFDDTAKLQKWENILHGVFQ